MAKHEGQYRCEKCHEKGEKTTFDSLRHALNHAQVEHGMTNKQRDEEYVLHRPR